MSNQPPDIQIPNIEKELNRIWNACENSFSKELPETNKPSKACLFTLVIYAHEERRVSYLQELVDTILDKFPCRIIFIQGDENATKPYFHVTVSNVISGQSQGAAGSTIACDQIVIKASQDQLFRVPFIAIPHIVPDLPIYLLWGQNPFEEREIFPHLQPYASRVIFDSECSDSLNHFCDEMQQSMNALKMDIMDISWALVSNWRDMLIQLFDTPEKIKQLYTIKSVIIQYNSTTTETMHHPEIRALYLQAWLACCLKWQYRTTEMFHDSTVLSYLGTIHPAVIALSPQKVDDLPPGAIHSIEITTSDEHIYHIERKESISQVIVHCSSKETCELPYTLPLPSVHKGLSFMREIFFSKLGSRYRDMLKIISEIKYKNFS